MSLPRFLAVLLSLFLPGYAFAEPAGPQGPGAIMQVVFLGGFVLIFYFLVWRPQSKRAKEHKALVSGISKGDEVLTGGGLAGRVVRLTDDFMVLEVAEKTEVKVQKVAVTTVLPKGTLKDI
jgi:preprotein translocase subunit YajC